MIQELREYSGNIFFKLLMGVIAVTFVLSFGVGGFFGDRKEVVAKVNDQEILLKEYREAYQNRLSALQQQFGENAEQFAEQLNLRQQVFNQLIDRHLLLTEAEEMNLLATDLELQDFISRQPYFQKNGQFDYDTYETVLSQNRIVRHEYESSLRADLLLTKKRQLLGAGLIINKSEVEQAYRMDFEKIEVDYVFFDPQAFIEKTSVNDTELRKYHEDHPQDFQTLNQFKIEYYTLSADYYKDSVKVREREVRRYYKKNTESYVTPPEIKARHILFKLVPDASAEELAEKRAQLDELLAQIKAGASFEELAIKHSEDGTAANGGDLGWFKPGEMVPAFETAAFALAAGEVSEVVQSPFGLHLIKVDELKEEITKSLDDARTEITEILAESRAQKRLDEDLDRLAGLAGESFTAEAQSLNKEVLNSEWFDRTEVISGLGSAAGLVPELMRRKAGEMGVWKRNPILGHVIYRLSEAQEPATRPFDAAKEDVESALRLEKAKVLAQEAAKSALSQVQAGTEMANLAEKLGLKTAALSFSASTGFLQDVGNNAEFRKVGLSLNEIEKFGLSLNAKRVDLLQFKKRTLETENAVEQKEQLRIRLRQNLQQALLSKELKRLRESAAIEIINPVFRTPGA
ncbi:MAG: SurA N-terminal domain-containing protein [SAR324 cluster bacterium]|nr:SurA N-terminal domain-containing protein [SAR324 cluster bacterium]MBL7034357.1 SurA N-terminal domain-containing protein [SAR324 cluster bacterium]